MSTLGADDSVPSHASEDENERRNRLTPLLVSLEKENFFDDYVMPEDDFFLDYSVSSEGELLEYFDQIQWNGESNLFYPLYAEQEEEFGKEEEEEETEEKFRGRIHSLSKKEKKVLPSKLLSSQQDLRRRSLFVHSSPTHFPDVNRARKSVFGSIFLRTPADVAEEAALLKTVVESSYTMLQALLNSFEKIISLPSIDKEKRQKTLAFRDSVQKALEAHGICKTYADGSVHWNIYPITQNYLFTVQIGNNLHQTRNLTGIEERILAGSLKKLGPPYPWPTGSVWCGYWGALGMAGAGTYTMPHGKCYVFINGEKYGQAVNRVPVQAIIVGKMQNGMFHDNDATLTYPNKFKAVHCVYENGKLLDCQFQFPDMLMHQKEDWQYCQIPDRRFWSEVQNGLKPAKNAQKTQTDPPKKIPPGTYDTGDGFYCPKSLMLIGSNGELLRVPVCEEDAWIKKYCRKGLTEYADFRPDLFENWFNYDEKLIQSVLKEQSNFRAGKITYDELQQFYADLDLLPSCSTYKKSKSPSEIAVEEYIKTIPDPKPLEMPRRVKKYKGHELPNEVFAASKPEAGELTSNQSSKTLTYGYQKISKSLLKFSKESKFKDRGSQMGVNMKSSKISFTFAADTSEPYGAKSDFQKRKIPEKYLAYQPLLKLPFETPKDSKSLALDSEKAWKKCWSKKSSTSSSSLEPEDSSFPFRLLQKENLEKFMKTIILEMVTKILIKERERHRKRLLWAEEFQKKGSGPVRRADEKCLKVLEELFESIPEKEEFCDSCADKTVDLKKLAEDKYNELKFWGKRIFFLDFGDETQSQ